MPTYTTNYNLTKIALTDAPPDITVINSNWDTVDSMLHDLELSAGNPKNAKGSGAYLLTTVFVDPSGLDSNDGLTESAPMKTIKAALDKYTGLPRLWLRVKDGTYTESEQIQVTGYTSVLISSFSSTGQVTFKFPLRFVGGFANLDNITVDVSAFGSVNAAVEFAGANFYIASCDIKGTKSTNGVFARWGGSGMVYDSTVSNCNRAIRTETGAVLCATNVTSTSDNNIGYSASNAIISANNVVGLGATTRYERVSSGVIFNNGNLVGSTTNVSATATVSD